MPVTNKTSRLLPIAAVALAACATGNDSDVNIGGGQSPDPVVLDIPVAYVRGPLPEDLAELDELDVRELETFEAGADVWLRDRAAADVPEHNVTERVTGGLWDVRDIDASYDGTRLVFAMRMPLIPGAMPSEQPTWNIWEYDRTADTLRRVIGSDIVAEEGHDVAPHYLPDGRIVFSSTRQRQSKAVLIDEGKPQFAAEDEDRNEHAFVLHVMNADGSGIRQISFNQSHDLDPDVLDDGRVVFSRWENASGNSIHLYTVNPDGSGLELLYGANSHATGTGGPPTAPAEAGTTEVQFLQPRPMEDGRVLALLKPFQGSEQGGDPVAIDVGAFVENEQPILANAGLPGPAQARLAVTDVRTDPGLSPGGRYSSVFPLRDGTGRLLSTWTMCRLNDGAGRTLPCTAENLADAALVAAPPLYGVWLYDPRDGTQRPVLQPVEGIRYTEVVSLAPRAVLPATIVDAVPGIDYDAELATENVGILNIRSVYDLDGADVAPGGYASLIDPVLTTADERPARFLRIEKAVGLPDDEVRDRRRARHARDPRLRTGGARRIGTHQGAGRRAVRGRRARRRRPPALATAPQLDAAPRGRGALLQRLSHPGRRAGGRPAGDLARAARAVRRRQPGCRHHRPAVSELEPGDLREPGRDDGRGALPRFLPDRLCGAAPFRGRAVRGRVDGPGRVRSRAGRSVRVPLCHAHDTGACFRSLPGGLDVAVPHHHSLPQSHPPAVVGTARGAGRHGQPRPGQHLHVLPFAGGRNGRGAGAGRAARPVGRRVARRG
jgi:hypothetical protein